MSVGVILLCHSALDRAAEVARHWAAAGCPVVVHLDARVADGPAARLRASLAGLPDVRFCRRHPCEWGTWGIVAATLAGAEVMLRDFPGAGHVYLASGACLPLRPVAELAGYLRDHPETDFIESVTTEDVGWTIGGLNAERFTLRFPFAWRRRRWLFDRTVALQRRLRLTRAIPDGITPHLGSQWWCLTRETLQAILTDPRRPGFDAYFRRVWIPDESYFQSLARCHARQIESRSLTLSRFDFQGKPHVFYDDHLALLQGSGCFVARKIWPGADALYRAFPASPANPAANSVAGLAAGPDSTGIDRVFAAAADRRTRGRPGLVMQGRFPNEGWENGKTAAPYSVFEGFADLFEDFEAWLGRTAPTRAHGHLFAHDRAEFAGGDRLYRGALSDSARLRDHNARAFLTNLIWNAPGERQSFQFGPTDRQEISWFMATDRGAQISVISGAWAVPLFRAGGDPEAVRREAARLQKVEAWHLDVLRSRYATAQVRIWSLADYLENPIEPLQAIIDEITPRGQRRLIEAPRLVDLTGFAGFLRDLRNRGMQPVLAGDFPVTAAPASEPGLPMRPYLVR